MRRSSLWWSLVFVTVAAAAASAQTSSRAALNLNLNGEGAAPPSTLQIPDDEPHTALVPNSTVRVVEDRRVAYDCFRYGVYWYIQDDGRWYRARTHRGPFRSIDVRYVPRAVMSVPAKYWHHPQRQPSLAAMREMRVRSQSRGSR